MTLKRPRICRHLIVVGARSPVNEPGMGRTGGSQRRAASLDLEKQSDKFALAVGGRLGENGLQLIARRFL